MEAAVSSGASGLVLPGGATLQRVLARATRTCAGCGQIPPAGRSALRRCARCLGVWYCSAACQRQHWRPQHKAACRRGAGIQPSEQVQMLLMQALW
jgi:hypothetical protein